MKILKSLLLLVFCFVAVSAQTPPTESEANKISLEVVKLFQQKKYDEALPLAQKSVELYEREVGKNNILVAQSLRNLGFICLRLNKSKEAVNAFEKALDIFDKNQPLKIEDDKKYVELLETSAFYKSVDGELYNAEKLYIKAIALREKVNGKDSIELANTFLKLAEIYQVLENYEKAEPLLKQALEINNSKLGFNNETEITYLNLICTYTKLEKLTEAETLKNRFYPKSDKDIFPVSIAGGVVNGKAINLVKPPYPQKAREKRISGTVNVKVTINKDGNVINACAVSGPKELQQSSELAAYQSTFSPTLLNGEKVKVTGIIVYNFTRR